MHFRFAPELEYVPHKWKNLSLPTNPTLPTRPTNPTLPTRPTKPIAQSTTPTYTGDRETTRPTPMSSTKPNLTVDHDYVRLDSNACKLSLRLFYFCYPHLTNHFKLKLPDRTVYKYILMIKI